VADGVGDEPDPLGGLDLVGDAAVEGVLEDEGHDEECGGLDHEVEPAMQGLQVKELHEEPLGVVVHLGVDLEPEDEDESHKGQDLMDKECY